MRLREYSNQKDSKEGLLTTLAKKDCSVQKSPIHSPDVGIIVRGANGLDSKVERKFDIDPENTSDFNEKIQERREELNLE